jgi:limonene 1,2-monooxygenase
VSAENGNAIDRSRWRVVASMHLAETREQAEREMEHGVATVGTPDDAIATIERLSAKTGGFGTILVAATPTTVVRALRRGGRRGGRAGAR